MEADTESAVPVKWRPKWSDEGAPRFSPLCAQVHHAVGVARDCQLLGAAESVADFKRQEVVHPPSENVVVSTSTTWESPPKPAAGPSEQVCHLSVVGSLEQEWRIVSDCCRFAIQNSTVEKQGWRSRPPATR